MRGLWILGWLLACEQPPRLTVEVEHPHGLRPGHEVRMGDEVVGTIERVDRTVVPVRVEATLRRSGGLGLNADACARPTNEAVVLEPGEGSEPFARPVVPACDLGGRAVQEAFGRLRDALERSKERGIDLSDRLEQLDQVGIGAER